MDFLGQLKVFVAVVDAGSFTRASQSLRMARPGVTKTIAELEKAVGARLLHRTTRRTNVTAEGEVLYAHATDLLSSVADARNLFGGGGDGPRGRLRVDIAVALAKPLIIPALPQFIASHPHVDVVLGVSDQPVDLVADAVDCVLRIGPVASSSMIVRRLASLTMAICAAPAYLATHGEPQTVDDLRGRKAVNYFSGRGYRPLPWTLSGDDGIVEVQLQSAVMVNDSEAFVACALAGIGLVQVPALLVAGHLASGRLTRILPDLKEVRWPLSILYPSRRHLAPQIRAFIDWTAELVDAGRSEWVHVG